MHDETPYEGQGRGVRSICLDNDRKNRKSATELRGHTRCYVAGRETFKIVIYENINSTRSRQTPKRFDAKRMHVLC